jgi:hypothetical protein
VRRSLGPNFESLVVVISANFTDRHHVPPSFPWSIASASGAGNDCGRAAAGRYISRALIGSVDPSDYIRGSPSVSSSSPEQFAGPGGFPGLDTQAPQGIGWPRGPDATCPGVLLGVATLTGASPESRPDPPSCGRKRSRRASKRDDVEPLLVLGRAGSSGQGLPQSLAFPRPGPFLSR